MRARAAALLVGLPLVLSAACGTSDPAGPDDPGKEAAANDAVTISQFLESGDLTDIDPLGDHVPLPGSMIYDTLLRRDSDGTLIPRLATSWTSTDPQTWRFALRDDVTFQDGSAFDAGDVKATLDWIMDKENGSGYLRFIRTVDKVTMVDPRTVEVHTSVPNQLLPLYVNQIPMLSDEQLGTPNDDHGTRLVGTGPYALADWRQGESVTLKRYEDYWDSKPAYATVVLKAVPEPSTRLAELQSGTSQLIGDVLPEQAKQLGDGLAVEPAVETAYMAFVQRGALADPKVRRALYLALDREAIAKTVFGDQAEVATSVVPQGFTGYKETFPTGDYDPAAAKKLLADAGVSTPIEVDLDTFPVMATVAELIRAQAKQVGFELKVNVVTRASLFDSDRIAAGPKPRIIMSTSLDNRMFDAYRPLETFFGANAFVKEYGYTPSPANQTLLETYLGTADAAERGRLSAEIQQSAVTDPQAIWLYFPKAIYATAKGTCYDATGTGQLRISALRPC